MLRVTGLVGRARQLSWAQVDELPGAVPDLETVIEGFSGRAVPVREVLEAAEPMDGAGYVTVESDDGLYRASIPRSELEGKGWLAFRLGEGPLPRERGGPFRLVVPEGRTLCWNVKGVAELRLTADPEPDSVPADPPH